MSMAVDEGSCVRVTSHSVLVRDGDEIAVDGAAGKHSVAWSPGGISAAPVANESCALPATDAEGSPLSWFQERLWIHHQRRPDNTSYNLPLLLLIRGQLDVSALEQSANEIVARHES